MPIYVYACSACGQRTEILHGINDPAPNFCPECGAEGTLRKGFAAPAVVFKGSGWAKKDRRATASASKDRDGKEGATDAKSGDATSGDATSGDAKSGDAKSGEAARAEPSGSGSGSSSSIGKPAAKASEGA